MNTDPVSIQNNASIASGNTIKQPSQAAQGGDGLGKDAFLRLLLAQMKAQDPLDPMDNTQFVAQLSQFTSLETLQGLGGKLDNLVTIAGASNSANAVSLLGKEVVLNAKTISGPTTAYYNLAQDANKCIITIRDEKGSIVQGATIKSGDSTELPTTKGQHEVQITGVPPGGKYFINVEAEDANKKAIDSAVSVVDKVKAVNFDGSVPILIMESGAMMKASDVTEIRQPSAVVTPPAPTTTTPPANTGSNTNPNALSAFSANLFR